MNPQTATRLETRQGAAWITLNRPENRNALSAALVNEFQLFCRVEPQAGNL